MNETACKHCYGVIDSRAVICPHCRTPLQAMTQFRQYAPILLIMLVLVFMSVYTKRNGSGEIPSFEQYKNDIRVKSSEFSFSDCSDCSKVINVVALGIIENRTNHTWDDVDIEVRYFNKEGKLVDSINDAIYGLALPPNSEVSFRIMDKAAKPKSEYHSHKVFINHASTASIY